MERIQSGTRLKKLLEWCDARTATDLHAQADRPFHIRVNGRLAPVSEPSFPQPSESDLFSLLTENFSPEVCRRIAAQKECDLSFYYGQNRYRANFSKQKGTQSFSFRIVPQQRLKLKDLHLPESLNDVVAEPRGLILVTGPTGQGKSTTVRA